MGKRIDLQGQWKFKLDEKKVGIENNFFSTEMQDEIILPTTTAVAKKGKYNEKREIAHLTEEYPFEGYAWYSREIELPGDIIQSLKDKRVILYLERTRGTQVWIDNQYVGKHLSFCAPHIYNLTPYIKNKKHKLTIMVSNVDYPTSGGHMTSPDTQTNWNGILGELSLRIYDKVQIQEVQLYPSVKEKLVKAKIKLDNFADLSQVKCDLQVVYKGNQLKQDIDARVIAKQNHHIENVNLNPEINELELTYPMNGDLKLWDEYNTNLYDFNISVSDENNVIEEKSISFGFRDFVAGKTHFIVNDNKTFLRGKHEGMIFPLTGHAPMDKEGWLHVFKIAKDYGINHYRFHTCCPPKAAFEAADEIGIYMQPEIPFWGTILASNEEGYNAQMQEFLVKEGEYILQEFGNHPSFVMMSMGNELWGNKEAIREMVVHYKHLDKRHLYTQGSNNFQFYPTDEPEDDFFSGVRFSKERLFRGSYAMCDAPQGHIQVMQPNTTYNYDAMIRPDNKVVENGENGKKMIEIQYGTGVKLVEASASSEMIPDIPVVSHEIGQYATYPNFKEIDKYTGVLKARNFEVFRERLAEKGLLEQADDFFKASGKLSAQCYKMELETAFRSEELAGFQLLDLQDFSGQGTALVGMLDAFMESKGIVTDKEWRSFCSGAVLLLEIPSFVMQTGQKLEGQVQLSYYRELPLGQSKMKIQLLNHQEQAIYIEEKEIESIEGRGLFTLASLSLDLPEVEIPTKVSVKLEIMGTDIYNQYQLWLYPNKVLEQEINDIVITSDIEMAIRGLEQHQKVLFLPKLEENPNAIKGTYCTDFWCYPMFKSISESMNREVPIGTMGLLIQNQHEALKEFACEYYTTPQWWDIVEHSAATILDDTDIKPIVQVIDNFERNHRLGIIFEATVDDGKLLVCTAQIKESSRIESKWLYSSLLKYMSSSYFAPKQKLTIDKLKKMFTIKEIY